MGGMLATSDGATGIIPLAVIGTLELIGQRLYHDQHFTITLQLSRVVVPVNVCVTRVKDKIKSILSIGKDANVHHQAVVSNA